MAVGTYENSYNRNKTRIDGRTDNWATRAGVTNQHKDMRGNVIGGIGADGTRFGTKAGGGSAIPASATPRLDAGVQTPRLDSNPRQSTADAVARSNRSGAFGTGAQNLQGRRDLFSQMQTAGAGGVTPSMKDQAAKLGVTLGGWDRAMKKLPQAPASVAAGSPATPAAGGIPWSIQKPAAPAMAPQPNATAASNPAVPRAPQFNAPVTPPAVQSIGGAPPTTTPSPIAALRQQQAAQDAARASVAGSQSIRATPSAPIPAVAPAPDRSPGKSAAASHRNRGRARNPNAQSRREVNAANSGVSNPNQVSWESPWAATAMRYRQERAKDPKTPLRSAWLGAGSGVASIGRNLTQGY